MTFPDTSNEIHKLIEPVDDNEEYKATVKFVENVLRTQAKLRCELTNRRYFGEEGKPRSRRNMIYCHDWGVNAGHEHTAEISQDAALLAANCGVPLMLSVDHPDQDPVFAPDGIRFNGRGDSCHDFIYPPTEGANPAAGMRSNRGQCRTECRDYDTLVSRLVHLSHFKLRHYPKPDALNHDPRGAHGNPENRATRRARVLDDSAGKLRRG